jgi:hypothetical protein
MRARHEAGSRLHTHVVLSVIKMQNGGVLSLGYLEVLLSSDSEPQGDVVEEWMRI